MKTVFFGTSDYCIPILESLYLNSDLKLVITRPDKPVGRKQILTSSATKLWAKKHDIPVATPSTLKKDTQPRLELELVLEQIKPDLAIVSYYGLIIPEAIFNIPRHGTVNIHFSKLPEFRGPSPVQFTLLRGDTEAWVTIFKLENPPELEVKMDSGPILLQKPYPILPNDTTQTLYTRLFLEAAKELPNVISDYCLPTADYRLIEQDHSKATFTRFLTKDDGYVKWNDLQNALTSNQKPVTSHQIYNQFRAMTPWPGLWTIDPQGKRMIIRKCHLVGKKLVLDQIQFEGKGPAVPTD